MNITGYDLGDGLGVKVALISDLHEKNPSMVIEALKDMEPDYIMLAGDLWERQDEEYCKEWDHANMSKIQTGTFFLQCCYYFTQFISGNMFKKNSEDTRTEEEKNYSNVFLNEASKIARIFMSVGNHEWYFTDADYEIINKTGTILLDNAHVSVDINGKEVLIGGLSTRVDEEWLDKFLGNDSYKILLCHHPEYVKRFIKGRGKANVILAGHAHGGQWRLFGRIPIYAPGQGLFPRLTKGVYETSAGKLIVSTGCANHINYPRWGNPCEIVMIRL